MKKFLIYSFELPQARSNNSFKVNNRTIIFQKRKEIKNPNETQKEIIYFIDLKTKIVLFNNKFNYSIIDTVKKMMINNPKPLEILDNKFNIIKEKNNQYAIFKE